MKLCMFHPVDHPMERGWVGRIEGEHVIHLAAQTLQSLFTGGGSAREHAAYALDAVQLLAPVLHPPSIRVFEDGTTFAFANPAAIVGPRAAIPVRGPCLEVVPRLAGIVGRDGIIEAFTGFAEWRLPDMSPPKDRDFALGSGPVAVTPDELDPNGLELVVRVDGKERSRSRLEGFDWPAARSLASEGTGLVPGDLLVGPAPRVVEEIEPGTTVEIEIGGLGTLGQTVRPEVEL